MVAPADAGMAITAATARKRTAKNRDFMITAPNCKQNYTPNLMRFSSANQGVPKDDGMAIHIRAGLAVATERVYAGERAPCPHDAPQKRAMRRACLEKLRGSSGRPR